MILKPEHFSFFKANGYLILPNVLDPDLCEKARDLLWASLPEDTNIKREDPLTHVGPFIEKDLEEDVTNLRQGYKWQLRSIGTNKLMIDLVYSEALQQIAEELLGNDTLVKPKVGGKTMGLHGAAWPGGPVDPALDNEGARGIYATLPYGDKEKEPDFAHSDGHPFNLSLVGLIDDVLPNGGAFKVWPGSHKRLYPTFQMLYDQPRIAYYEHLPSYKGIIQSEAYEKEMFRQYQSGELDKYVKPEVLEEQREFRQKKISEVIEKGSKPPQENMWQDWSEHLNEAPETFSDEMARSQNLID